MPEWLARLAGHPFDLEALADLFPGPDPGIRKDDDRYYLTSPHFVGLTDGQVYSQATALLDVLNGAAATLSGARPVEVDAVSLVEDDGTRRNFIFASARLEARANMRAEATVSGPGRAKQPLQRQQPKLASAIRDEKVKKALRIFGSRERNWHNLFKVFEVIESDVGGTMIDRGWITKRKRDLFTQTANSAKAVGDDARHGHDKVPAPKNPIPLSEAEALVRSLLQAWLHWKGSEGR